jgi:putative transport protein
VVGRRLGDLDLEGRFGATATRLRRGDLDLLARPDLVLEPGDRLQVVAPRAQLSVLGAWLGDSETAVAQIDFVAVALGLAGGILLGTVTLPGGITLGAAGGTLLAGIVLGALGRVRRRTFALGHQASLTLRQVGTVVFLAAVGSRSGAAFAAAAFSWRGLATAAAGATVTATAMTVVSWAGRRWLGVDDVTLAGAVAGAQTQPAVLAFAERQTGSDQRVAVGYTALYPAAMVLKIVAAQLVARL